MPLPFKAWLTSRLAHPLPGYQAQKRMVNVNRPEAGQMPANVRKSAVLLLIYPQGDDWELVLIERSRDGGVHSGQIAFPGGRFEDTDKNLVATALREAEEEVSLKPDSVEVLGLLTPLYIPVSNFEVQPVVAFASDYPEGLLPCDQEVARILHFSFRSVFPNKEMVNVRASGGQLMIHTQAYILSDDYFVWGATAMILAELEALWEEYNRREGAGDALPMDNNG